jgi:hypothetical protein
MTRVLRGPDQGGHMHNLHQISKYIDSFLITHHHFESNQRAVLVFYEPFFL